MYNIQTNYITPWFILISTLFYPINTPKIGFYLTYNLFISSMLYHNSLLYNNDVIIKKYKLYDKFSLQLIVNYYIFQNIYISLGLMIFTCNINEVLYISYLYLLYLNYIINGILIVPISLIQILTYLYNIDETDKWSGLQRFLWHICSGYILYCSSLRYNQL